MTSFRAAPRRSQERAARAQVACRPRATGAASLRLPPAGRAPGEAFRAGGGSSLPQGPRRTALPEGGAGPQQAEASAAHQACPAPAGPRGSGPGPRCPPPHARLLAPEPPPSPRPPGPRRPLTLASGSARAPQQHRTRTQNQVAHGARSSLYRRGPALRARRLSRSLRNLPEEPSPTAAAAARLRLRPGRRPRHPQPPPQRACAAGNSREGLAPAAPPAPPRPPRPLRSARAGGPYPKGQGRGVGGSGPAFSRRWCPRK